MDFSNHEPFSAATLTEWARRFVRTPSPQTERFETEPAVQAFIDDVGALLRTLDIPYRRDAMGSLIAELGPDSQRSVMLMAYAMTHPASNMRDPYAGDVIDVEGKRAVRGRGVSEQKGSLAAALAATHAAYREGALKGRVVFTVSSAGETGRHDAARSILAELKLRPTASIIVIGTTSRVSLANKGRIDAFVTVRGRVAHSSTPWRGIDAIAGAREVLQRLERVDLGSHEHTGLGKATLTPTAIRSFPEATHTLQGEVRMTLDRRLLPGESPAAALRAIEHALDGISPWKVEVREGPIMFPAELAQDSALLQSINRAHREAGMREPTTFYSHGALDAGLFAREGIETTMWGPGDMDQWHSDDEYVLVDDLLAGAKAYYLFLRDYVN
jgi:acetylornithine deacetylase/succinyl-diaminopimelate desuccinylase-like protein